MILFPLNVPVDPHSGPAREWIIAELSKPEYQAAKPTWFDQVSAAFWHWLNSLKLQANGVTQAPILLLVGLIVIAGIVAAYFFFGPPRLNRRSSIGALFGHEDERNADAMRRSAVDAAARGDYTAAIEELFRSLARGLTERTIVTTSPGTTARDFAARAGAAFPALAGRLVEAAVAFDRVRYLGETGTAETYGELLALEGDLRNSDARATLASPVGVL